MRELMIMSMALVVVSIINVIIEKEIKKGREKQVEQIMNTIVAITMIVIVIVWSVR